VNDFLAYAAIGKLIIYIIQIFPLDGLPLIGRLFQDGRYLYKWWKCDLCLGVWVYAPLSFLYNINFLPFYIPVINEIIMGMVTSFLVHLISLGWKEKFTVLSVEWTDADNE